MGLKALILVGGFGTRLRPLTLTKPKPMVEFANKAMVLHQMEELAKVGVTQIVLAVSYRSELMESFLRPYEEKLGVKITISEEEEPLGTAGPLALAKSVLGDGEEPFFVLNSDVVCDFPFDKLAAFHKNHGKEGTILVTKVEDPSKYGVVISKESGEIIQFVEKPSVFVSNRINAGIYIFSPAILDRIELKPTSIEKEIFPLMAHESNLFCMDLPGFWMDVGQPKDFLAGLVLYLDSVNEKNPDSLAKQSESIVGPVLIDPSAKIGNGCIIGPHVAIGPNVVIEDGVRISKATLLEGAIVKQHSWIHNSIIGWNSRVGRWCRVNGVSVLGEDVALRDEKYINGARILPHKSISVDIPDPQIVM